MIESRYLVREGNLQNEKRRPRYAALMNDLLVVCKPAKPQKVSKKESVDALYVLFFLFSFSIPSPSVLYFFRAKFVGIYGAKIMNDLLVVCKP
jgi:hypothetical protein